MILNNFVNKDFTYAVVGVSQDEGKFGYRVYKRMLELGFKTVPVNPKYSDIEGEKCYASLDRLPAKPDVVVTIVPPAVTEKVVEKCIELGVKKIWMQPGSESDEAVLKAGEAEIDLIYNACFVVDGTVDGWGGEAH